MVVSCLWQMLSPPDTTSLRRQAETAEAGKWFSAARGRELSDARQVNPADSFSRRG
jgi:hypothetical protein